MNISKATPLDDISWDALKLVLTIARHGNQAAAGRALNLSHATVLRQLNKLEQQLGVRLFERLRQGYQLTPAGQMLTDAAYEIEARMQETQRSLQGQDQALAGSLHITTTDTLHNALLAPLFVQFQQHYPNIQLIVQVDNRALDLNRREADIAIRPTQSPPESWVGRPLGILQQALYRSRHLIKSTTPRYVGITQDMGDRTLWAWQQQHHHPIAYQVNSIAALKAAILAGAGVGPLPCYLGEADHNLERVSNPIAALTTHVWMLTHADLRHQARVNTLMRYLAAQHPMPPVIEMMDSSSDHA